MFRLKSISLQLRFLLLGLTLLSVLSLDKREVAIYLEKPATEHTFKASPKQVVLKEKVSFEAVTSFLVLPEAILPATFHFDFSTATVSETAFSYVIPAVTPIFKRLLATAISPNAP